MFGFSKKVEQSALELAHELREDAVGWLHDLKDQINASTEHAVNAVHDAALKLEEIKSYIASHEAVIDQANQIVESNTATVTQVKALVGSSAQ